MWIKSNLADGRRDYSEWLHTSVCTDDGWTESLTGFHRLSYVEDGIQESDDGDDHDSWAVTLAP